MDTGTVIGIVGIILAVAGFFIAKQVRTKKQSVTIKKSKLKDANIVFGKQENKNNYGKKDK